MQIRQSDSLFAKYADRLSQFEVQQSSSADASGQDFKSFLAGGVKNVNDAQSNAQSQIEALLTGQEVDTAEVITSIQKADMAFQLLVQVRNKLMKAYEEIQAINI